MFNGEISLAATDCKMPFPAIISKTSNTGCVWSFQRIPIVHIESVICILVIIGIIPLIVCHLFYVVGRYYIIPDIRNPSTLILSSEIMYRYVLWQIRCSLTEHSSTARGGGGVFYFKLMNKTSWQEHFWQMSGALDAALCQDPSLKLVRVHDKNYNSCIRFIIFTSPKPGGDQRSMGIDHMCVYVNISQS